MPRAALLSIHARVERADPSILEHPSLVQVWGPRYSAYVVPARDARSSRSAGCRTTLAGRQRAEDAAARSRGPRRRGGSTETGERSGQGETGAVRRPTGTVLIRWEGARAPLVWTVPRPEVDPRDAVVSSLGGTCTLRPFHARVVRHVGGHRSRSGALGVGRARPDAGANADRRRWILSSDEPAFRERAGPAAAARLLPSGDPYYLLQGAHASSGPRPVSVAALWTSRVWPGAVLVGGEIVGTWRARAADVTVQPGAGCRARQRAAVEAEAASLPLPGSAADRRLLGRTRRAR